MISLVREPIGRNISAFFQNLDSLEGLKNAHNAIDTQDLIADFVRLYKHDVPLTWFDSELHATTGIDVYKSSFPIEKGYQVIDSYPYNLIIIRHDLDDRLKQKLIGEFLGVDTFNLATKNEASKKQYADTYRDFLDSIKLPPEYVEQLLSSKYAQHFYSREEINTLVKKWT